MTGTFTFSAVLFLEGKTATGIEVPPTYVEALGGGKRPPVVVTFPNGYTYRSTVAPYDGRTLLPVAAVHREAAGLHAGDQVTVVLSLDTAPRAVVVPEDLAAALALVPGATSAFEALSPSAKKAHVTLVEGTKNPETRQRRIEKVVASVHHG